MLLKEIVKEMLVIQKTNSEETMKMVRTGKSEIRLFKGNTVLKINLRVNTKNKKRKDKNKNLKEEIITNRCF